TPVRTSPSPMTNSAAMSTTLGSLKPASASSAVTTPSSGSSVIMSSATMSMRGLLTANMTMVAASKPKTMTKSVVTEASGSASRESIHPEQANWDRRGRGGQDHPNQRRYPSAGAT